MGCALIQRRCHHLKLLGREAVRLGYRADHLQHEGSLVHRQIAPKRDPFCLATRSSAHQVRQRVSIPGQKHVVIVEICGQICGLESTAQRYQPLLLHL